jgi:GWxTD domain-containing protein
MTPNAPRVFRRAARWTVFTTILVGRLTAQPLSLGVSFQQPQEQAAAKLIERVSEPSASQYFLTLDRPSQAAYLDSFWVSHNPLLHRYYFGHHLGQRRYSVSDAFFERDDLIPLKYRTGFTEPDSAIVQEALDLSEALVKWLPTDPLALSARGYLLLEAGRSLEAELSFIEALKIDERCPEAHNGKGLSYLPQKHRLTEALYHFRDAIALDDKYAAALYDLAMCHLAMGSIDLDHRFGMVVDRFPDHHDAHYKLGVAYENLYFYKKSAGAYSNQLVAHPDHTVAKARLARVNLEMSWTTKRFNDIPEIESFVGKDPLRYLPLLAETHMAKRNYEGAGLAYNRYFRLLRGDVREIFEDITLLVSTEESARLKSADPKMRLQARTVFWMMQDPTPTTPTNERRLEHYRRVNYAISNFGLGEKPWDKRGEVYIQLGHPDHRSWSGNIVFETDPAVMKVKNRLNNRTFQVRGEIMPGDLRSGGEGLFSSREMGDIRGLPVFPVPRTGAAFRGGASVNANWESWIYARAGGGIELTFIDYRGEDRFDFARVPEGSPSVHIWRSLAPETVFARATSTSPDHYEFDYGGAPLTFHLDHATFRGEQDSTTLELYLGVPSDELGLEMRGDDVYGQYDRQLAIYDGSGRVVYRDSTRVNLPVPRTAVDDSGLLVSQIRTELTPGTYIVGARVRDPGTGKTQVGRERIDVSYYAESILTLSDLEVARTLSSETGTSAASKKGDLNVLPHPSRTFKQGNPVYLYYEVYNLLRDQNGETRYRVDYRIRGGRPEGARRLVGRIARFLGEKSEKEEARISYEYEGIEASEPLYIELDLEKSVEGDIQVGVTVTDLKRLDEPSVTRTVTVRMEDE